MAMDFDARDTGARAMAAIAAINKSAPAGRILRSAARGITSIKAVASTAVTMTQGAVDAVSTITSTYTPRDPRYYATDARYITPLGGPAAIVGATNVQIAALYAGSYRKGGHGNGIAFSTRAQVVEVGLSTTGTGIIVYVTDLSTGVRLRGAANDYTTNSGRCLYKFDTGFVGNKLIEVYGDRNTTFTGVVVDTANTIWAPAPAVDRPKVGIIWDSYGQGVTSGGSNTIKLTVTDYFCERLGVANYFNPSDGGTGFISTNSGLGYTFGQRIGYGDINATRIGDLDLLVIPASVNDSSQTDAAVQAAAQSAIVAAMIAQPKAIIAVFGPQSPTSAIAAQSRFDAIKTAVTKAAAGDPRVIYVDNSPSAGNFMYGSASSGINQTIIGTDNVHMTDAGGPYLGYRMADALLLAITTAFP